MTDKLDQIRERFKELEELVSDPEVSKDHKRFRDLMRERSRLQEILDSWAELKRLEAECLGAREIIKTEQDLELKDLASMELEELEEKLASQEKELELLLVPVDPMDDRNTIMEIRAGTGGEEAALFASDLYRMYSRYAENRGWKTELMSVHETGLGGIREIIFSISGEAVYGSLRWESGGHRVQRIPATEGSGRIHTSAVTVAVLPEAEEAEIDIRPDDIRIDVMRSSGPGGQSVNTTDSAVRITHLETGITVHCQDEKSQIKNKAKAMRILRARLYEMEEARLQAERSQERKNQVGSGDRSGRIRTYNFPQNRLTDHRIDLTLYKLDLIMEGDLDEILTALKIRKRDEALGADREQHRP